MTSSIDLGMYLVSRRAGGLEKDSEPREMMALVSRRAGGLEMLALKKSGAKEVSRRAGGLEKVNHQPDN